MENCIDFSQQTTIPSNVCQKLLYYYMLYNQEFKDTEHVFL